MSANKVTNGTHEGEPLDILALGMNSGTSMVNIETLLCSRNTFADGNTGRR